jgi:hypothetical protein
MDWKVEVKEVDHKRGQEPTFAVWIMNPAGAKILCAHPATHIEMAMLSKRVWENFINGTTPQILSEALNEASR